MNASDFRNPKAGRIIRQPHGYAAFVPTPLPPVVEYSPALVLALSRADAALSELSGLGRTLPNPHLLIAPYLRREAVLSSRIEGTQASLADLLLHEIEGISQRDGSDVHEVQNYVVALEHGIDRLKSLPLSLRLVREVHGRLMNGVRGGHATPGEFRRSQNWIGPPGSTLETSAYVPPPIHEMTECLTQWERFLHQRNAMPDLIQCALMHEQFEAIHPFLDGNGRVGRLLITLFLMERDRLSQPLLYVSVYIEANRQTYYDLLQRVRTHGDWVAWLHFFLRGIEETAQSAVHQARQIMDLRESLRDSLRDQHRSLALLDTLFVNPYLTAARAADVLGVSAPTARRSISLLEQAGVLHEISGRAWGRLYLAGPILQAIQVDQRSKMQSS